MARFAKKIGALPSRYQFDLFISHVTINVPYDVNVITVMKRGKFQIFYIDNEISILIVI